MRRTNRLLVMVVSGLAAILLFVALKVDLVIVFLLLVLAGIARQAWRGITAKPTAAATKTVAKARATQASDRASMPVKAAAKKPAASSVDAITRLANRIQTLEEKMALLRVRQEIADGDLANAIGRFGPRAEAVKKKAVASQAVANQLSAAQRDLDALYAIKEVARG